MKLPDEGYPVNEIFDKLEELSENDIDPRSGKLFAHIYESGDEKLYEIAIKAFLMYIDKTMLNFTVYPSILKMENEVVGMVASLFGDKEVVGNFTYGGTESIFLALKTARDYFRKEKGFIEKPKIIIPYTGHPAFVKSARYLGLDIEYASINRELEVDINDLNSKIDRRTIAIVGSAPNYPYGTLDNIEKLSEIALENNIWLHVDACIGGFVLPFFKELGVEFYRFDFELEGVYSLSVDLHKYGYAPKGSSIILYKNDSIRKYQIYVNASWPGYPIVNTTVLSSRSAGPLAASYAILNYLGYNGYLKLARKILNAKTKIIKGLGKLGFEILGKPKSSIITFTSQEVDIFNLADMLKKSGWYVQLQPGSKTLGYPPSIHLTISPIHEETAPIFLETLKSAMEMAGEFNEEKFLDLIDTLNIFEAIEKGVENVMDILGLSGDLNFDEMSLINKLIYFLPPAMVEETFIDIVNKLYSPA